MKQVTCKSGLKGSQSRLRNRYDSLAEFQAYSDAYGLAARLGYKTDAAAWKANPVVQGSVEPSDFCKVKAKPKTPQKCPACKHYSYICIPWGDEQD